MQTPPASAFGDLEQPSRIRLICLACSQQNLAQYRAWAHTLNDYIELMAVDVERDAGCAPSDPQRGPSALAHVIADRLQPFLSEPHALFGQHLGAHMAFELAQLAERRFPGRTRHLFVSSCDSPRVTAPFADEQALRMPVTVLYPAGALPGMLGWHAFARRELELIELPEPNPDTSSLDQRFVRIFNTHLGLLSF
ncbi:thioesterase domain-containing protein [Pseudomonas entomophila]|uniref:thioesterase domain-containing protein n=1 Tax=Pseudomonas entomophila TaxID=312306 RepID=UPI0023D8AC98|nr:thioesterase domain-containing protein [Pseudomonas entomophila]MDF0733700.1 thioesterase domain-containing protein [Pseudomonas entomophila]